MHAKRSSTSYTESEVERRPKRAHISTQYVRISECSCVCVCVCVREREREKEKERWRETCGYLWVLCVGLGKRGGGAPEAAASCQVLLTTHGS